MRTVRSDVAGRIIRECFCGGPRCREQPVTRRGNAVVVWRTVLGNGFAVAVFVVGEYLGAGNQGAAVLWRARKIVNAADIVVAITQEVLCI